MAPVYGPVRGQKNIGEKDTERNKEFLNREARGELKSICRVPSQAPLLMANPLESRSAALAAACLVARSIPN